MAASVQSSPHRAAPQPEKGSWGVTQATFQGLRRRSKRHVATVGSFTADVESGAGPLISCGLTTLLTARGGRSLRGGRGGAGSVACRPRTTEGGCLVSVSPPWQLASLTVSLRPSLSLLLSQHPPCSTHLDSFLPISLPSESYTRNQAGFPES